MAASTPYSTPSPSTAAAVPSARNSSLRRKCASRRNSRTSISRAAAYTTSAPSAAVGNIAKRPREVSMTITKNARATNE